MNSALFIAILFSIAMKFARTNGVNGARIKTDISMNSNGIFKNEDKLMWDQTNLYLKDEFLEEEIEKLKAIVGARENKEIINSHHFRVIGEAGSKQFFLQEGHNLNWYQSWNFCRRHNLYLAEIMTESEHNLIASNLNDKVYWIGGNDLAEEGKFVWFGSGKEIDFKKFHAYQPDNAGIENCLEYRNLGDSQGVFWNDWQCHESAYCICQK